MASLNYVSAINAAVICQRVGCGRQRIKADATQSAVSNAATSLTIRHTDQIEDNTTMCFTRLL